MIGVTGRRGLPTSLALLAFGAALLLLGGSKAIGWVALAGVPAVIATVGAVRRWVGAVLAVMGLAVATTGVGGAGGDDTRRIWASIVGGVAVALAGCLVFLFASRWRGMSARYDRDAAPGKLTSLDLWRALDRGEDPTETASPAPRIDEGPDGQR